MARLVLRLLGPLQVVCDGSPVAFTYDKVPSLLAYLAVEAGRAHARDSLGELLWPDRPSAASHHNLSQALTSLRKAIGDQPPGSPFLSLTRETAQFNAGSDHWLDAAEFSAMLDAIERHEHASPGTCAHCAAQLESAIALYQGEFLDAHAVGAGAGFEQWVLVKREAFRERVLRALAQLTDYYGQVGDFEAAGRHARRQIELDSWREAAHRQLMRLLALSGQRGAALAQYERCRQSLISELGVEPDGETASLYEAIKAGTFSSSGGPPRLGEEGRAPPLSRAHHRGDGPRHNLPAQPTPFVGREREMAALAARCADPDCRLITLAGPGGIGKTRLAVQAALDQVAHFADGAWFVPLAPLSSPDLILQAIADALVFAPYGVENLRAQLLNLLHDQHLLLVLDNFEHLLAGAAMVADIIETAPRVKVLVTSRERLNLRGEWLFEVEGLSLPTSDAAEDLEGSGAVRFFAQSARRARSSFVLRADNRSAVARICRLVGGMPLGIELAVAWLPVLSSEEIVREIAHSLDFLAGDLRDAPERHRSMRAVFDHSWRLLTESERAAFRRLSVFGGGFTREAAEAAAGASLIDLSRLTAKSLIRRSASGRYEVHELLRQYGAIALRERPEEAEETRGRHGHYYLTFLGAREAALKGRGQQNALAEVAGEMENIRAAWEWAAGQCNATLIAQSIDALWLFTEVRGRYSEAETQFRIAAETLERAPDGLTGRALALGKALVCQGSWYMRLGEPQRLKILGNKSLALFRPLNARREIAFTLNMLAAAARVMGAHVEEGQLLRESIALGQASGDRWIVGYSLNDLGMATFLLGAADDARRLCGESLVIFREAGDERGMAFALNNLGAITGHLGDLAEAERLLREGLALWRANDHRWGIATTLVHLGVVARARRDPRTARACFLEAIETAMAVRTLPPALDALVELAALKIEEGDLARAGDILAAVLQHPARTAAAQAKSQRLLSDFNLSPSSPAVDVDSLTARLLEAGVPESF